MTALSPLDRAHRADLQTLTALAERDLAALWDEVSDAEQARDALMDILPHLVAVYGSAAATLAADYYDNMRDEAGARGRFSAIPVETAKPEALDVLARVAAGSLFGPSPQFAAALVIAGGGLQRHVANADRETIRFSSVRDPNAEGWVRVGPGECAWCQQHLDGSVHRADDDFSAHDHCNCTAVPVFS